MNTHLPGRPNDPDASPGADPDALNEDEFDDTNHEVEVIYPHGFFSEDSLNNLEARDFTKDFPEDFEDEDDLELAEDLPPSKSQLKRDAHKLLDLGKQLVELSETELDTIPLESHVRDAITHAKKIRAHGALKRQLHYLGKLLRKTDADPIYEAMDQIKRSANAETSLLHELERWRDQLIADEKPAMNHFFELYPNSDRQQLRQLLRNHKREKEQNRPPKAYREIFKWLREAFDHEAE